MAHIYPLRRDSSHIPPTVPTAPTPFVAALCILDHMIISQNYGDLFGGPNNKDYSILGSILGFPYFEKLPYPGRTLTHKPPKAHMVHLPWS